MTHSDDEGLVLPPKLAPIQVVVVPIPKPAAAINERAEQIMQELRQRGISVQYDDDPKKRPGFKFAENEMKGIPVRIGIGVRDLEKGVVEVARRDTKEKTAIPVEEVVESVAQLLEEIQQNLFDRAVAFRENHTHKVDTWEAFQEHIEADIPGFISAHWDGTTETELKIKALTKATIRCIPNDAPEEAGTDLLTGKPSKRRVLFAKAY